MRVNGCFKTIDVLFSFATQQLAREGGGVEQQALDSLLADEQLALFGRRSASRKFRAAGRSAQLAQSCHRGVFCSINCPP